MSVSCKNEIVIGVLALQGAFEEHQASIEKATGCKTVQVCVVLCCAVVLCFSNVILCNVYLSINLFHSINETKYKYKYKYK